MRKYLLASLLAVLCFYTKAQQVHVNREWRDYTGNPVFNPVLNPFGLEWTKSIVTATNDIVTVAHTNVSGQGENILLTRYTEDGSLIWQVTFNTSGTNNDYGIDVIEDPSSGDLYVCGTTDNGGTTNYDIVILKYNSAGTLQTSSIYDNGTYGANDIATAITIDSNGNICVAGSTEQGSTLYDYLVLNFDTSLSLLWTYTYDHASLTDIPVGLEDIGGKLLVAGASASSLTNWDYTVVELDVSIGGYLTESRNNIPGIGYDQPLAFKKDASGNTYITGRASSNGINYDIRTAKISPLNNILWTQTYDANGLEDCGNTIAVDASGNVIVGGFITKPNNIKELVCLKYNPSGTLLWQHSQPSKDMTADAYIKKLVLNSNNEIYFMAGEKGYTGNKEVVIGKIKPDGKKSWERNISGACDYLPSDLQFGGGGLPGLFTITVKDSAVNVYEISNYSEHARDTARVFKANGKPWYKKNELIVRFQASAMDTAAINNHVGTKIMEYGDLSNFLTASAFTTVINALSPYCGGFCDVKAVKMVSDPTTFTSTVSRLGETIPVPDFWTGLRLEFPTGISVANASAAFKTIPQIVAYTTPNYFIQHDTPLPNDTMYKLQHAIKTSIVYPNAGINVEEAWDVDPSGGKSFVKVGIFDAGVHYKHLDFDYDGNSPWSSKVSGWDLVSNQPLQNNPIGDIDWLASHGTACAGIIGATRNNTIGIAGIAGGNWLTSGGNATGVKLYSLNIWDTIGSTIEDAANVIIQSSKGPPNIDYRYGLNIMNHSWGITASSYGDSTIAHLNHAIHFANRLQVTVVASRGNDGGSIPHYPANTDDDWVLCVGATASDGNYKDWGIDDNAYAADYGGVDIAAPGSIPNLAPLAYTLNKYGGYNPFSGTSAAAPQVAGAVGLLMSYMNVNNVNSDPKNLAPEDCEFIIQKTASPMPNGAILPNDSVGYGRLNIGKAMRMVEKPYRTLYHFSTANSPYTISKSVYSINDTVILTENYQNKSFPQMWFQNGKYVVKTFKINVNVNHALQFPTDSVMYCWPRHSSSEVFKLFDANKKVTPRERIQINSYSGSTAHLEGYIYQVKDTLGNHLGWWPCDTSLSSPLISTLFSYSMLTKNTAVGVKENTIENETVSIYPNPANNNQTIKIKAEQDSDVLIQLYDVMGRLLKVIYNGKLSSGENTFTNDVGGLPNSMYIYIIKIDDTTITKRFIKQ